MIAFIRVIIYLLIFILVLKNVNLVDKPVLLKNLQNWIKVNKQIEILNNYLTKFRKYLNFIKSQWMIYRSFILKLTSGSRHTKKEYQSFLIAFLNIAAFALFPITLFWTLFPGGEDLCKTFGLGVCIFGTEFWLILVPSLIPLIIGFLKIKRSKGFLGIKRSKRISLSGKNNFNLIVLGLIIVALIIGLNLYNQQQANYRQEQNERLTNRQREIDKYENCRRNKISQGQDPNHYTCLNLLPSDY